MPIFEKPPLETMVRSWDSRPRLNTSFSPRTWGWSEDVLLRVKVPSPFSPRAWGWSHAEEAAIWAPKGSPQATVPQMFLTLVE